MFMISTDFDVETWPAGFDDYKCIVSVGHDEYYSATERTQLQRYSDGGGNIAFFSGNLAVWQVCTCCVDAAATAGSLLRNPFSVCCACRFGMRLIQHPTAAPDPAKKRATLGPPSLSWRHCVVSQQIRA